jgi:hypothetical protein
MYKIEIQFNGGITKVINRFNNEKDALTENHNLFLHYLNKRDNVMYYSSYDDFIYGEENEINLKRQEAWEGPGYYNINYNPPEYIYVDKDYCTEEWTDEDTNTKYTVVKE